MADSSKTRMWLKFFTDAGIPSTTATDYALTFADNRMQKNMLLDLKKEYLNDMGITLMGDVIAILRHARTVHDQVAREKINSVMKVQKIEDEEEDIVNEMPSAKKTGSAVTRILDHYTRNPATTVGTKASEIPEKSNRLFSNKVTPKKMRVVAPLKRKTGTLRSDEIEEEEELDTLRTLPTPILRTSTPAVSVSSSDSSQPVKKIRRVLPEHEGGYTVTMPKGSTPRSKEILEKFHEIKAQHPKNVFDRLGGESKVTSTTQPDEDIKFRITINNKPYSTVFRTSSPEKTTTSVFERLGNKTVKNSILKPSPEESRPLPYSGILKPSSSVKKVVKQPKILSTMRADEPKVPICYRAVPKSKVGTKKTILVKKKIKSTVNTGTEGILGKSYSGSLLGKTPVKDRLGSSSGIGEKRVNKINPVKIDTFSSNDKSFDSEAENEEESFHSPKEKYSPPLTSKRVSFGKIEQKFIPKLQMEFIPDDVGSIVMGTGMFKQK